MSLEDPEPTLEKMARALDGMEIKDAEENFAKSRGKENTVPERLQAWAVLHNIRESAEPNHDSFGHMREAVKSQRLEPLLKTVQTNPRSKRDEDQEVGYHRFSALRALTEDVNPQMVCRVGDTTLEDTMEEFKREGLVDETMEGYKPTSKGRALVEGLSPIWNSYDNKMAGDSEAGQFIQSITGFNTIPGEKLDAYFQTVETDHSISEISGDLSCSQKTVGNWYRRWRDDFDMFDDTFCDRRLTVTGGRNYAVLSYTTHRIDESSETQYIKTEF
ncbi:MAG: hypothetical protein ABEK16_03375 [Candidatus Nanohalobium sp.]